MIPPSETSSIVGNQTSSLEPIKDLLTIKETSNNLLVQIAPDALKLADKYDYAYDTPDLTKRFLKNVAVFQKWIDMSISTNTFYNPTLYPGGKIPAEVLAEDIFLAYKLGLKTLYYNNVKVEGREEVKEVCAGGACEV